MTTYTDTVTLSREEYDELCIRAWKFDLLQVEAEKQAFAERQKAAENKAESLKKWLSDALAGEKFKTTKVAVSFRKTQSVQVSDILELDEKFVKFAEPTADKTAIKAAIKAGEEVKGAMLIDSVSLSVK